MTTLLLIRHGAISYGGRVGGAEAGLNTLGELQARALGRRLMQRNVAAVYTSPLRRATDTAELLAQFLGAPVHVDERLLEVEPGDWGGANERGGGTRSRRGGQRAKGSVMASVPGQPGEALGEMAVVVCEEIAFSHPGQEVAVVSDGGLLSALIGHFLGLPPPASGAWPFVLDHCSLSVLELGPEGGRVRCLNDTSHLEGLAL